MIYIVVAFINIPSTLRLARGSRPKSFHVLPARSYYINLPFCWPPRCYLRSLVPNKVWRKIQILGNQRSGSIPSLFTFILRSVPVPIFGKNSGSIHIRVKLCSVGWIVQRGCSGLKTSNSNLVQLLFTFGHCLVDASGNQILKFKPCSVSVHIQTLFSWWSVCWTRTNWTKQLNKFDWTKGRLNKN